MHITEAARRVAEATDTGYSFDRYGSWPAVALGLTETQAAAVMLSKWMRWAADASEARYGKVPASAIAGWVANGKLNQEEIDSLVRGTFPSGVYEQAAP